MPYIAKERRPYLEPNSAMTPTTEGELNYQITVLIRRYIAFNGKNYERIGDVTGALENAKAEFYRRVVAPYEDEKIQSNGDVYP